MGGLAMGEHKYRQKKSYNTEINYKHSKGGYGRLPLDNDYVMDFFLKVRKIEKTHSITLFHKFIQQFVDRGFSNLWKLVINRIFETPKTTLCTSKQMPHDLRNKSFKTTSESLNDRAGPKTTRRVK